jgi:hypothetical protein
MDAQPDVAVGTHGRLRRVDAHADAQPDAVAPRVLLQCALSRERGLDGVLGATEGDEEGVALRVDLLPAGLLESPPQKVLVLG